MASGKVDDNAAYLELLAPGVRVETSKVLVAGTRIAVTRSGWREGEVVGGRRKPRRSCGWESSEGPGARTRWSGMGGPVADLTVVRGYDTISSVR